MQNLTDKQKKRLKTLAKVIDNGNVAILEHVDEIEDRVDDLTTQIPDVKRALDRVQSLADGEKGERGDKGDRGERGPEGPIGRTGAVGPKGERGERGIQGVAGRDGVDGNDGAPGRDGVDGFIDEATIAYLEDRIDNIPKASLPSPIGIVVREVQAGTGISIDNSNPLKPIVSATGSSADTFETVSKNLDASGATLNYTGDNLTSITYANGITKTLNYTGDDLTSVVLSGATPSGIDLIKTLAYTGDNLTSVTYS